MPTDWSFLDEYGELITGCEVCHGSRLEGFDPYSETEHTDTTPCSACLETGEEQK